VPLIQWRLSALATAGSTALATWCQGCGKHQQHSLQDDTAAEHVWRLSKVEIRRLCPKILAVSRMYARAQIGVILLRVPSSSASPVLGRCCTPPGSGESRSRRSPRVAPTLHFDLYHRLGPTVKHILVPVVSPAVLELIRGMFTWCCRELPLLILNALPSRQVGLATVGVILHAGAQVCARTPHFSTMRELQGSQHVASELLLFCTTQSVIVLATR
jgi:hypothetical protein